MVDFDKFMDPLDVLGENCFDAPREVDESEIGSPVQEYFRDAVVFVTGGTGFLGKVLIEKLLRTCPHLKHIYALIREKKSKNAEQRLDQLFTSKLFNRLKHEVPMYHRKVSAVSGDCSLPGLGLSENSRNTLINEVNIIFHGAATVRFNEHIRVAMSINVLGTREVLNLARELINLKAMAHISTAYSNCNRFHIEEKLYPPAVDYEKIINLVSSKDDKTLEEMTSGILGSLPNTYSFTKSLGEEVIRREGQGLPIFIFRPTIVIATYREPVRGWTDNLYGPTGMLVGAMTGVLHTYFIDLNIVPDLIPVDICVNALICATVDTTTKKLCSEIPIYTCSSSGQKPVTWMEYFERNRRHSVYWPTIKAVWFPVILTTTDPFIYTLINLFCHIVPGFLLDTLAVLNGQKPRLLKIYQRLDQVRDVLSYFAVRQWTFGIENMLSVWDNLDNRDKKLFNFDINQMSWEYFSQAHTLGLRTYLLNDDVKTLPEARRKYRKLKIIHNVGLTFVYVILMICAWSIICLLLKVSGS